ncbi:MAG: thermopsin family protease [Thermoplasmata archaeon]
MTIAVLVVTSGFAAAGWLAVAAPPHADASDAVRNATPPRPIAFLPISVHPIGVTVPAVVHPTAYYNSEPAPMGIGDFGVGAGGQPYTYSTTEFLGNFSWQSLNIANGSNHDFSNQLNVVLQFTQGSTAYSYWIQDVAFMDSSSGALEFENNIWNFTNTAHCLSNSALSGNGTVYSLSGCEGYYAVEAFSQPGAFEDMSSPGDFSLLVRSYLSGSGVPEVAFEYWDGVTSYEVTFDNVAFPWATAVSSDRNFYVDGNATAPSGNFYDAELTLGGPGGGSATVAGDSTDASSRLLYWNGHNFEATRAVWNFGSDTAEAISNVQSFFSHDSGGTPSTTQLNGTARNATPAMAYDQRLVGVLSVSAPNMTAGTISVAATSWNFQNGGGTLTLVPGAYPVWVNSTSEHVDLGVCEVVGGATTNVSTSSSCLPTVATPVGTPPSVDVGQGVTFGAELTGPGSGGDTFDWGSLPSGLGCTTSASDSIACRPTDPGTYSISVTVTDSDGQSNSSGTLDYVVDSDPSVGAPTAEPPTAETGAVVTFAASPSGGSGGDAFDWTGLPVPCSGTSSSSPVCHPGSTGSTSVSVRVTDSNGFAVTSPILNFTAEPGPSVSTPVASPSGPMDLGGSTNFSATASGGVGPYTYSWNELPVGCASANLSTLDCDPSAGGTFPVTVTVTDSAGGAVTSGPLLFTVNAPLAVGPVTATPGGVDVGQAVTFGAAAVSGGDGAYSYAWSGLPPGCSGLNASSLRCVPTGAGTFAPRVTVTDSEGSLASGAISFTISSDPSVGGVGASRSGADVGQVVVFTAERVSGGTSRYSYVWTNLPTGCATQDSISLSCAPAAAGEFSLSATVSDSNGANASARLSFPVDLPPTVAVPASSAAPGLAGDPLTLRATVAGGSGSLGYVWSGLPPGCGSANASTVSCTPSVAGVFRVIVTVDDSNGASNASAPLALTVDTPVLGLPPTEGYLLLGAIAAAGVVAAASLLYARRRRGSGSSPRPP